MERSDCILHTQVEAKRILYWVVAVVHITWINRTGQYDITLTHFQFFLLSSSLYLTLSAFSIHYLVEVWILMSGLLWCGLFDRLVLVTSSVPVFYSHSWTLSSTSSGLCFSAHALSVLCCCFTTPSLSGDCSTSSSLLSSSLLSLPFLPWLIAVLNPGGVLGP